MYMMRDEWHKFSWERPTFSVDKMDDKIYYENNDDDDGELTELNNELVEKLVEICDGAL